MLNARSLLADTYVEGRAHRAAGEEDGGVVTAMRVFSGAFLVAGLGVAVGAVAASTGPHWVTVSQQSVSGSYPTAVVAGTIKHPAGMRFQVTTSSSPATVSWDEICSEGLEILPGGGSYKVAAHVSKADHVFHSSVTDASKCVVSAKAAEKGGGAVTLALQKYVS